MKKQIGLISCLILICLCFLFSCTTMKLDELDVVYSEEFNAKSISNINVELSCENLEIGLWKSNLVKVVVFSDTENVDVDVSGGLLSIESDRHNIFSLIKVYLPVDFCPEKVEIESLSGNITGTQLWTNRLVCETTSGKINLTKPETQFLDLSSISGSINLNQAYVQNMAKISSVSGSINFLGEVPAVDFSSTSGRIDFVNLCKLKNNSNFSSISGAINITLPETQRFVASYETISGKVTNIFTGYNGGSNSYDSYGNGSVKIKTSTISGNIGIYRK